MILARPSTSVHMLLAAIPPYWSAGLDFLQPAYGNGKELMRMVPSTSAHMLLAAMSGSPLVGPSSAFNQRTYAACSRTARACGARCRSFNQRTYAACSWTARTRYRWSTPFNQRTYAACSGKKYRMLVVHGLLCVHLNLFECIAQPPTEALTATISNYGREVARHTVRIEG